MARMFDWVLANTNGRKGHGDSNDPPSGAMATPPTAAIEAGNLSTAVETSSTARDTDPLERVMAQALNDPPRRPCPTVTALRRRRAAVRESHDVRREHRCDRKTPEPN